MKFKLPFTNANIVNWVGIGLMILGLVLLKFVASNLFEIAVFSFIGILGLILSAVDDSNL